MQNGWEEDGEDAGSALFQDRKGLTKNGLGSTSLWG